MKGGTPQVTTTSIDPQSQGYVDRQRAFAQQAAAQGLPGLDPNVTSAIDFWRNAQGVGQRGLGALGGDVNAANQFMNPYFAQMNPLFERMRQQAASRAQLGATSPFGTGAREGLASSSAIRDVNDLQTQASVGAFNEAMNRAQSAANFGFGANQSLFGAGDYLTNRQRNWDQSSLGLLQGGLGPTGQVQKVETEQNLLNNILGGALGITGLFGNPLGFLGGLFSGGGGGLGPIKSGKTY